MYFRRYNRPVHRLILVVLVACGGSNRGDDGSGTSDATTDSGSGTANSACTITSDNAICHTQPIVSVTYGSSTRRVWWATPSGTAPSTGWPAVVLYQGTNGGPTLTWDTNVGKQTLFGAYYQIALVSALLDAGFTVIQPEAVGGMYWYTNVPTMQYATSPDASFIPKLLAAIDDGTFGPVDKTHLYATGISSGGYMTSRMAVSYGGTFRALAIASGSYATCLGSSCNVPTTLPADHPPTLFLHGEMDNTVPIATAHDYEMKLIANGKITKFVSDPNAAHEWLSVAPTEITTWFTAH